MKPTGIQPIQDKQRLVIIDILRGWALLGVVIMNYYDFYWQGKDFKNYHPGTFTVVLQYIYAYVFSAKSWTMLSFLFGYGFAVLMDNLKAKGRHPVAFFAGRMWWLLVLAFINSMMFGGDILRDYAVLGIVLLLFYKSSPKTTFYVAVALLLATPVISFYVLKIPRAQWNRDANELLFNSHRLIDIIRYNLVGTYYSEVIGPFYAIVVHVVMLICFLLGFSAKHIRFFDDLGSHRKTLWRMWWITLVFALLTTVPPYINKHLAWPFSTHYNLAFFTVLSTMFWIMCSFCLLYLGGYWKLFFDGLKWVGKMTLTNYMTQNLLSMLIFSGVGLGISGTKPLYFYMVLAVSIYLVQVFFSRWWLRRYYYGPIEWVWRMLSYWKWLPLKREISH
jgi:uncharacterized protein